MPLANARGSDTRQANKSEPRVTESEPRAGRMYKLLGENVASKKYRNPINVQNQCRGEPCVRPPNNNRLRTYVRGKR
ncbi:MAG: hypothetical protein OMM_07506, partial [Candidatus Magnetoglobus multicellularis str. Araruama]